MDRRAFLAATASTTLVAVAGCSGDGNGGDGGGDSGGNESGGSGTTNVATASESAAEISASGTTFDPLRQEVEPGTEVVWTNNDEDTHNIEAQAFHDVAEEWSIDSTPMDPGDTVSHTFEESGVYEFFCAIHGESNMCGAVLVGDVSLDEDLPCEGTAEADGNESGDGGNATEGNETSGSGNETAGNDSSGSGNETEGNGTSGGSGNGTSGNESA